MPDLRISFCICTSGRPAELARCLGSIAAGTRLPMEAVVSDDSRDARTAAAVREVCARYSGLVQHCEGPRRGLCANRNHVIRQAKGTHLSLLDDDALVSRDFVERAESLVELRPGVIWTGDVLEKGLRRQSPTNPTFLGHFGHPVRPGERLENISLNCNVLPRSAFEVASFDEVIVYGYEDTDLCAQLLASGFEIVHESNLTNEHHPPMRTVIQKAQAIHHAERARFSMAMRRYGLWRRNLPKLLAFMVIAPLHFSVTTLRHGRPRDALSGWGWLAQDLVRLRHCPRGTPALA